MNKTLINHILQLNRIYSQKDCYFICANLFALEESKCGCNSNLMNFDKNCVRQFYEPTTLINETKSCIANYLKDFQIKYQYEKCSEYCPLECDSWSYIIDMFSDSFPTVGPISNVTKNEYGLTKFMTYEQVQKSFMVIFVYYNDLKYTLISEEPKTELFILISEIGGILGLFLGISFLSFFELFEILFEIFHTFFSFKRRSIT